MKQDRLKPTIPRKSHPLSLPLLITNDCNSIKLHSFNNILISELNINKLKPNKNEIEIEIEIENKSNEYEIKYINLLNNF